VTTYSAGYASKTNWQLRLVVTEGTLDAVNNRSFVSWVLQMFRGDTDQPWNNSPSAFSVSAPGGASGSFHAYRFGGTGTGTDYSGTGVGGTITIASGGDWVAHNPDGTGSISVSASHAAAATLGTATIGAHTFTLTTLSQAPGTPTALTATRVSDTQTSLAWTNNSASNGAPTTNNVQESVNGGAFAALVSLAATTAASVTTAANRKSVYEVNEQNATGTSAWSASATVFTTPAPPTGVVAAKDGSGNIAVSWTDNVAFAEHAHVVEHGTITGGVTTWDGSPLATVAAGTATYTHVAPSSSAVHVYRVSAKNTDTGALQSATVVSNSVLLLAAPNKPTLPVLASCADKAAALVIPWVHNPVDTTAQVAYEFGYSTNGGTTWSSTGKVTSGTSSKSFAASTYAANVALTVRVRTWGQATAGGSDGTGASPWSDQQTVTFKTKPVATITAPANSSTYTTSALAVALGFSQAESAAFVSATIQLYQGATLLETVTSTTLASTVLSTPLANGTSYTVKATVLDSNGLVSSQVTSTFSVAYTLPVAAAVTATFLEDSGIVQLGIAIAAPGGGQAAATAVTITRSIDGVAETIVSGYPAASSLTILDMTPTIYGDNVYTVTTVSAIGATASVTDTLTVAEDEWAYMSTGSDFSQIIRFGGELKPQATPTVDTALVKAAGRSRPIGMYATTGGLVVSGTGEVVEGIGSSAEDIEAFLLTPGKGCYRDPTGRRMFGAITGQVSRDTFNLGTFTYTVTETS
jgi:hypothetical protein